MTRNTFVQTDLTPLEGRTVVQISATVSASYIVAEDGNGKRKFYSMGLLGESGNTEPIRNIPQPVYYDPLWTAEPEYIAEYATDSKVGLYYCPDGYYGASCNISICHGKLATDPTSCSGKGDCIAPNTCVSTTVLIVAFCLSDCSCAMMDGFPAIVLSLDVSDMNPLTPRGCAVEVAHVLATTLVIVSQDSLAAVVPYQFATLSMLALPPCVLDTDYVDHPTIVPVTLATTGNSVRWILLALVLMQQIRMHVLVSLNSFNSELLITLNI